VPNRQRYTDLLEARLPAAGTPPVEVYNFGLSSTGTDQQYLIWREFARGIDRIKNNDVATSVTVLRNGTATDAVAEGSCCGSTAKADAVASGQGCCG